MLLSIVPDSFGDYFTIFLSLVVIGALVFFFTGNLRATVKYRKWKYRNKTRSSFEAVIIDKREDETYSRDIRRRARIYKVGKNYIITAKSSDGHDYEFKLTLEDYHKLAIRDKGILYHYRDVFYGLEAPKETDDFEINESQFDI